jgi:hypothetical protein
LNKLPLGATGNLVALDYNDRLLTLPDAVWRWQVSIDSSADDMKASAVTDSQGNVYVAGSGSDGTHPGFYGTDNTESLTGRAGVGSQVFIGQVNPSGEWQFQVSIDSGAADQCPAVAVDHCDFVVVSGHGSSGSAPVYYDKSGNPRLTGKSTLTDQVFVGKMNRKGDWIWQVSVDSTTTDSHSSISIGKDNSIYLAFHTSSGINQPTFYNKDNSTSINGRQASSKQIILAKISPEGVWQWAVSIDSNTDDCNPSVVADEAGNVYIAGDGASGTYPVYYETDGSTEGMTGKVGTQKQIFLGKINSDGKWQWNAHVDANDASDETNARLAIDGRCEVLLSGQGAVGASNYPRFFNADGSAGATGIASGAAQSQVFLGKIDSDGNWQWNVTVNSSSDDDVNASVTVDARGNVYLAGQTLGGSAPVYYGTTGATAMTGSAAQEDQVFLGKLSPEGVWQWNVSVDGSATGSETRPWVAVDQCGNVFLAGQGADNTYPEYYGTTGAIAMTGRSGSAQQVFLGKIVDASNLPLVGVVTGVDGGNSVVKYSHVIDVTGMAGSPTLTPGKVYYLSAEGNQFITDQKGLDNRPLGVAISSTELYLNSTELRKCC